MGEQASAGGDHDSDSDVDSDNDSEQYVFADTSEDELEDGAAPDEEVQKDDEGVLPSPYDGDFSYPLLLSSSLAKGLDYPVSSA